MTITTDNDESGSAPVTEPSRGEDREIGDGRETTTLAQTSTSTSLREEKQRRLEQSNARKNKKDPEQSSPRSKPKLRLDDNPVLESPSSVNDSSRSRSSKPLSGINPSMESSRALPITSGDRPSDREQDGDAMIQAPNYEDDIQAARDRAVRDVEQAYSRMLEVQVAEVAPPSNVKRMYYIIGTTAAILAGGIAAAILLLATKDEASSGDTTTIDNFGNDYNVLEQYFVENTFVQVFEGRVDESYTVTCTDEATDIGVVATNATSGTEQCVDSLPSSVFKSICESDGKVDVQLEGDYRGLVLGLGYLREDIDLDCTGSAFGSGSGLLLKSIGGDSPSAPPTTLFSTLAPTPEATSGPTPGPTLGPTPVTPVPPSSPDPATPPTPSLPPFQ